MDDSITTWIRRLKESDPRSQQEIWNAYFHKLVALARQRLGHQRRRDFDEEDIALSAFNSFFRAVEERRLPQLDDRHDLWKVLVVITARKISTQRKRATAEKRGGGKVRGESVFAKQEDDGRRGLEDALGPQPTPQIAAEVTETFEQLMNELPDTTLQQIAQRKLEGYTNLEISQQLGCVERTVERKLEVVRKLWQNHTGNE